MPKRGIFVVLEGCDHSGKSTQAKLLKDWMIENNEACELWHFPDRSTKIGSVINEYLRNGATLSDQVVHLLFSANRWEKAFVKR